MKLTVCSFVSEKATTTAIALTGYDAYLALKDCIEGKRPFTCKGWTTDEVRTWFENGHAHADEGCNRSWAGEREYNLKMCLYWATKDEVLIEGLTNGKLALEDEGQLQLMEEIIDTYEQRAKFWGRMMREWEEGL